MKTVARSTRALTRRTMSTLAIARDFPASTARPSTVTRFPGVSPAATQVVRRTLEANDRGYDIYEKARFAHNHFPHSILTRYALGATSDLLQATWEHDRQHLVSLDPKAGDHKVDKQVVAGLPDKIDAGNWTQHLGKKETYSLYLAFFHQEIARLGIKEAVQFYLFSPEAGTDASNSSGPQMLMRSLAGVIHPFIHTGFGLEFGDVIIVAEGLAEAAVHQSELYAPLYPPSFPNHSSLSSEPAPAKSKPLLALYAKLLEDPVFAPGQYDPNAMINDRMANAMSDGGNEKLRDLVTQWGLSEDEATSGWAARLEEVAWFVTLLACGTTRPGFGLRVDFFLMHALTSSIFLQSYMEALSPKQGKIILEAYLLNIFLVALSRGRPRLYISHLMSQSDQPGPSRASNSEAIADARTNPWLAITDNALLGPDSHTPKSIRSLLLYAEKYGATPVDAVPGLRHEGGEAIEGAGELDGTVFIRAAGVLMDVMGWVAEGEQEGDWDRSALGYDDAWKN